MKLHLGCGKTHLDGYVNIDLQKLDSVDVVEDISQLHYKENSVDEIIASHCLEHFLIDKVPGVLKSWYKILKAGGKLLIAVPDIEMIFKAALLIGLDKWVEEMLYGGQKDKYSFHYSCFDYKRLSKLLTETGFKKVKRVDSFGIGGCSGLFLTCDQTPLNIRVSLNIIASK